MCNLMVQSTYSGVAPIWTSISSCWLFPSFITFGYWSSYCSPERQTFLYCSPLSNFVPMISTPFFCQLALSLTYVSITKSYQEDVIAHAWKQLMDEIQALVSHGPLDLVLYKALQWLVVYTIKFNLDGSMYELKVHLVVKMFSQTPGVE